ncbi:hypothetical protein Daus18300_008186 [Diaporthe australafricana]|uniref:NACHT-NTPase and P-loop NTPases N-terminal domain-containing protein n=1 Tax=Diaporthe australafricana TaxID=127596 RepID=A0ABR3WJL8_9PEZI
MVSKSTILKVQRAVRNANEDLIRTQEAYDEGEDEPDLPEVFHSVAKAFPAAQEALEAIHQHLSDGGPVAKRDADEETAQSEKEAAATADKCAGHLVDVFETVVSADDGARAAEYQMAAGKDRHVEVLTMDILEAVLVLAKPPAVNDEQVKALEEALRAINKIQKTPAKESGAGIINYGSGTQTIHQGKGDQNVNTGTGQQFNGTFAGPAYTVTRG